MQVHILTAYISLFLVSGCLSFCVEPVTWNVFQFPFQTWVENIAVRANGDLLVTLIDHPELHLINPFHPGNTTVVSSFPDSLGLLGIAEYDEDQFAVVVGNWSDITDQTTPHSYSIWRVDMSHFEASDGEVLHPAEVEKIVDIPEAIFLNGMTALDLTEKTVLVSDSGLGGVWLVDIVNRTYRVAIEDLTMQPSPPYNIGINGLHLRDKYLYYTNSGSYTFCRMPINADGSSAGQAQTLVTDHLGDDFTFDKVGNAYVTQDPGNALYKVTPWGNVSTILGGVDDPLIEGDTAAKFGRTSRDSHILYITTNGGLVNPVGGPAVGGKVVAFNTECVCNEDISA